MADIEPKSTTKDLKKCMVKALFSYTPENPDELQLNVDDVLEVIEETEEGWWKGALNGNVGMFPSNFVIQMDQFPEELNNKSMNELSPTKNLNEVKHVTQQETLPGQEESNTLKVNKSDLNVNQKAIITGKSVVDGNSLAKITNPYDKKETKSAKRASVTPIIDSSAPQLPPKPIREQAKVMFPYTAQNEDELSLKEGDVITIISKEIEDKGWWRGELAGKVGVFPDNFVELLKVEEQKKPERPDKPSTAVSYKANLRVSSSEKQSTDSSPRHENKTSKTPPAKPPPPDIKKKDEKPDRPVPPFVSKKPQLPPPMKKPLRPSVSVQATSSIGFGKNATPELVSENPELKTEPNPKIELPSSKVKKTVDVGSNREERPNKNDSVGFDVIELSSDKLVHLTANRAKAPNRRPPSHIFLKESEKDSDVQSITRRLSEPLISDMNNLLLKEVELYKAKLSVSAEANHSNSSFTIISDSSLSTAPETKPKITPAFPQSVTRTITSESSHNEKTETMTKKRVAEEDTRKVKAKEHIVILPKRDTLLPELLRESSSDSTDVHLLRKELNQLKSAVDGVKDSMVSRYEFTDLCRQINEMKETIATYRENFTQLKEELEREKKLRIAAELELDRIKQQISA